MDRLMPVDVESIAKSFSAVREAEERASEEYNKTRNR